MKKSSIKELLKKGLTGEETARVIYNDFLRAVTGEGELFTDSEHTLLVDALVSSAEGRIYNHYTALWKQISSLVTVTTVYSLKCQKLSILITNIIHDVKIYDQVSKHLQAPKIVTEKEYKDTIEAMKAEKLKGKYSLSFLFFGIAQNYIHYHKDKITEWAQYEKDAREGDKDHVHGTDLLKQLYTYYIEREYLDFILENEYVDIINATDYTPISEREGQLGDLESFGQCFPGLGNMILKDIEELLNKGKLNIKAPKGFYTATKGKSKEINTDNIDKHFSSITLSGKDLYNLEIDYINKDLFEKYITHAYGNSLAIIQDPPLHDLDKKGYYKPQESAQTILKRCLNISLWEEEDMVTALVERYEELLRYSKTVFNVQNIIKILGEKAEIDFSLMMKEEIEPMEGIIDTLSDKIKYLMDKEPFKDAFEGVKKIDIKTLKQGGPELKRAKSYFRNKSIQDITISSITKYTDAFING
jgi:hypothetical protein